MKTSNKIPASVRKAYTTAKAMRKKAHAPYSKFRVGAALITNKGEIIGGCNVENASYGATVCAERVAIFRAVSESKTRFSDLVVVTDAKKPAYPCALCLQVMAEFLDPETRVWIADIKSIRTQTVFRELLPFPFGPRELKLGI